MSSLQRVAAAAAAAVDRVAAITTTSVPSQKGEFEACFAGGLDLSEFAASSSSSTSSSAPQQASSCSSTYYSHAAALLQVKQAESATKLLHEREDAQLLQDTMLCQRTKLHQLEQQQQKEFSNSCIHGISLLRAPPPSSQSGRHQHQQSPMELLLNHRSSKGSTTDTTAGGMISALVVGMHGAEQMKERRHKLNNKMQKISKRVAPKLKALDNKQPSKGKQQVAKKSKRRKF